jgi:uncharacterized protein YggE
MSGIQEKRLYGLVLILVVAVVLLGSFALYTSYRPPGLVGQPPSPEAKTISVGGTGTVSMNPDIGWFLASVATQAGTAAQAEEQNNNGMAKVISALTSAGIAEKDIQTTDYSLSPIYQDAKEPGKMPVLVGYSARHTIRVNVNDLSAVGRMLDLAISCGVNDVGGVYFGLSTARAQQAQAEALDLAVKDASSKAGTIADSMSVTLVGPISVNLAYYYAPVQMNVKEVAAQPVPIMPGQLQYTVNVQVVYAFS